jgi:ParB-like chromosome segregation protein Spo0J
MDGIRTINVTALEEPYRGMRVCDRRTEARMLVSMQALGQKTPMIVIGGSAAGAYAVVDGHKRLRVLKALKADVAQTVVWTQPAAEALAQVYRMQDGGAWNALEEGALVEELHRIAKWPLRQIAQELERTVGWASRRLGLIEELPGTIVEAVQQGKIGVYSAIMCLLPLSRDNRRVAERLAGKLAEGVFTTRQIRVLYEHCLKGPPVVTERIASDPGAFLKALGASRVLLDLALSENQNKHLDRLRMIGNTALGLARDLPGQWEDSLAATEKLTTAWQRCQTCLSMLEKTVTDITTTSAPTMSVPGHPHA